MESKQLSKNFRPGQSVLSADQSPWSSAPPLRLSGGLRVARHLTSPYSLRSPWMTWSSKTKSPRLHARTLAALELELGSERELRSRMSARPTPSSERCSTQNQWRIPKTAQAVRQSIRCSAAWVLFGKWNHGHSSSQRDRLRCASPKVKPSWY